MLVRVQHGTSEGPHGLSGAEEKVVTILESWGPGLYHLPGLTLVNVNVPDKATTRQVDALLFTPSGLIVVEVKGFTRPQAGQLTVPPNGPWLVDGDTAAVHTLAGANPGEQCKAGVYAAKAAFAKIDGGGDAFVVGLVVLVTRDRQLTLGDTSRAGTGIHVALGTNRNLRRLMHRQNERRTCWSADGVRAACDALALAPLAPAHSELLDEGFPESVSVPSRTPSAAHLRSTVTHGRPHPGTTSSQPTGSRPPHAAATGPRPLLSSPLAQPSATTRSSTTTRSYAPPPQRSPGRGRGAWAGLPWALIIGLLVLVVVGTIAAVFVNQLFHGA